jgi:hypothetical protein
MRRCGQASRGAAGGASERAAAVPHVTALPQVALLCAVGARRRRDRALLDRLALDELVAVGEHDRLAAQLTTVLAAPSVRALCLLAIERCEQSLSVR